MINQHPTRLTTDGRLKFAPCFAPDGRSVLFSAHLKPNLVSLARLNLDGGVPEMVFPSMTMHQHDPCVSPDGRWIVYAMSGAKPQLFLMIYDFRDRTEIDFRPREARATARAPRVTPDGGRIVFSVSDVDGHQIASIDRKGGDLRLLTQSIGTNCWPSLSPDGKQVVFCSSRDGHFQLYVMKIDGSGVRRLCESPSRDMRPAWSPDGRWIAFTGTRGGNHDIYLIHPDGTRLTRLTDTPEREDYAAWSPDSKRLVVVAERGGDSDLYAYEIA